MASLRMRPSSNLKCAFPCFLILSVSMIPRATSLLFNFTSFHDNGGDIVLQGDAYVSSQDGHIELTTNSVDRSSLNSSGRAIYSSFLPLWDKASGELADFTTHFSFVVNSLNDTHHGDGFILFLADPALPSIDEAKGGGIGLLRGDQVLDSGPFRFLGVEFDTFPNDFDPGYEHVGIDINSLKSSAQVGWCNSVLQGKENDVWIRYDSVANNLSVEFSGYCNGSDTKFRQYLHYQVDLASFLPEKVVVGFAAATGVVSELHIVKSWYLNSSLAIAPNSAPPPGHRPEPPEPSSNHLAYWVGGSIGGIAIVLVIIVTITLICIRKRRVNAIVRMFDSSTEHDAGADHHQTKEYGARSGNEEDVSSTQFHTSTELSSSSTNGRETCEECVDDEAGPGNRFGSQRYNQRVMDEELKNSSGPKVYSYEELAGATNGFDVKEQIGDGGFGKVFKGTLGAVNIAVKVSTASPEKAEQYASEVLTITQVKHKNLVRLLGWCHENDKLLLVYEFLSKGSLDSHVFDAHMLMPFELRYNIVVGLAEALHYLHEELKECVLHRDVKLSNILLDSRFRPKLADFGLAKIMDREKLEYTTRLAGTLGYMAPELLSTTGKVSKSTDMYSFGVVVLEVACGRKALPNGEGSGKGLVPWVWELHSNGKLIDAADPRLLGSFDKKKMMGLLMVGLRCTNPKWESRMDILQAWHELKGAPAKLPRLSSKRSRPTPM